MRISWWLICRVTGIIFWIPEKIPASDQTHFPGGHVPGVAGLQWAWDWMRGASGLFQKGRRTAVHGRRLPGAERPVRASEFRLYQKNPYGRTGTHPNGSREAYEG